MNKHTPAPWRVERQNPIPTTGEWMIAGAKPGYLAEVRNCGSGSVEANARLIAAAPDLLEALIEMTNALDLMQWKRLGSTLGKPYEKARAAIARVTGEMNEPR